MTAPPADGGRSVEERLEAVEVALHRLLGERPPPVWSWIGTTDPDTATAVLTDLAAWVHDVWLTWPDAQLPGCWARHPDIVEELWALRNLWATHESRGGTWAARVDWLERYRPNAAKRLTAQMRRHDSCRADPQDHPAKPSAADITAIADDHCAPPLPTT